MGMDISETTESGTDSEPASRSEQAVATDTDSDIDDVVDRLVEVYHVLAGFVASPGPCPTCTSQPAGRCPTLATMDEIREFIADRRPNRLCELFE